MCAHGPVCVCVQPFEILLIIDRLPCFVIIMNGIPHVHSIHHDVFFRDTLLLGRTRINRDSIVVVDRPRGM